MPNVNIKIGEIEAILDMLIAIKKKGQWLQKLEKNKSVHAQYFPEAIDKSISMFSQGLHAPVEAFDET